MGNFSAIEINEDELPKLETQECNQLKPQNALWKWNQNNWWNIYTGERLIDEEITYKSKIKNEELPLLSG